MGAAMKYAKLKRLDHMLVLTPRGQFVGGDETEELQQILHDLAAEGNMCLVVNLGETTYISSRALGVLVSGHVNYSKRGARMKICNLSEKTIHVLVITSLLKVFDVHDNEEQAIASFAKT
jgi:anti-sigma B factor antagonist